MKIEIDQGSGFCFGVTRAIGKAEEELAKEGQLYCLGDIVHNGKECNRLQQMGLVTINHEQMRDIHEPLPAKGISTSLTPLALSCFIFRSASRRNTMKK